MYIRCPTCGWLDCTSCPVQRTGLLSNLPTAQERGLCRRCGNPGVAQTCFVSDAEAVIHWPGCLNEGDFGGIAQPDPTDVYDAVYRAREFLKNAE